MSGLGVDGTKSMLWLCDDDLAIVHMDVKLFTSWWHGCVRYNKKGAGPKPTPFRFWMSKKVL
jgi:hypothetical protein